MLAFSTHLSLPVLLKEMIARFKNVDFGNKPCAKIVVAEVGTTAYNKLIIFVTVWDTVAGKYADLWIAIVTLYNLVDTVSAHVSGVVVFVVLPQRTWISVPLHILQTLTDRCVAEAKAYGIVEQNLQQ